MTTVTPVPLISRRRVLLGAAGIAMAVLVAPLASPAAAASAVAGVTGSYAVLAASNSQSPKLQSYSYDKDEWTTVTAPNAWFAVGPGKKIGGAVDSGTPVRGGEILFRNTASTAKSPTFTLVIPAGVGLRISSIERSYNPVNVASSSSTRNVSFSLPTVSAGSQFSEVFDWTFTTSATAVDIPVQVSVPGTGGFTATSTYRFTF